VDRRWPDLPGNITRDGSCYLRRQLSRSPPTSPVGVASEIRPGRSSRRSSDNPIDIAATTESLSQSHSRFFGSIAVDTATRRSIRSSSGFTGPHVRDDASRLKPIFPRWEPAEDSSDGYPIRDWAPPALPALYDGNLIGHAPGGRDPAEPPSSYSEVDRSINSGVPFGIRELQRSTHFPRGLALRPPTRSRRCGR
jgi:hypothetical protein